MNFTELVEIMSSNGVVNLADIARKLEVSPQSVSNWKARDRVPYKYVVEVQNRFDTVQSTDGPGERYVSTSSKKEQGGRETAVPLPPFMMEKERTFHLSELLAPIADNVDIIVKSTFGCFFFSFFIYLVMIILPEKEVREIDLTYATTAKLIIPGGGGAFATAASAQDEQAEQEGAIAKLIRGAINPPVSGSGAASLSLTSPSIWPELLTSHAFAKRMLLTKYDTERYGEQKALLEINQLLEKEKAVKPPTVWQKVFGIKKMQEELEEPKVGLDTLIMQKMSILPVMIRFGVVGSFQTLTVTTFEPHLSVDICYSLLEELQKFSKHFQDKNLQEKRQYIEKRIEVIGKELDDAREEFRVFTETNRTVSSLRLQWELQKVEQQVSHYQGIYTELITQLENVKIQQSDQPASEPLIVDYPIPPLGPEPITASTLRSLNFVFLTTLVGLGFGFIIALAKGYFSIVEQDEKRRLQVVKEKAMLNIKKLVPSIRIGLPFRKKSSFRD